MRQSRIFTAVLLGFLAITRSAAAHEFWLDALDYTLDVGQDLQIGIRVGQDFKGNTYSFNPSLFRDFSMTDVDGVADIQIDIFQRPANGSEVVKTHVVTDETGLAFIPITNGDIYMINAVHMIIPSGEDIERTGAVWHSLWASLTFKAGLTGE